MRWRLFGLLAMEDFTTRFPEVGKYYLGDDIKRLALAGKIADLFDQYQVYPLPVLSLAINNFVFVLNFGAQIRVL